MKIQITSNKISLFKILSVNDIPKILNYVSLTIIFIGTTKSTKGINKYYNNMKFIYILT